jgi:hypothetical protein
MLPMLPPNPASLSSSGPEVPTPNHPSLSLCEHIQSRGGAAGTDLLEHGPEPRLDHEGVTGESTDRQRKRRSTRELVLYKAVEKCLQGPACDALDAGLAKTTGSAESTWALVGRSEGRHHSAITVVDEAHPRRHRARPAATFRRNRGLHNLGWPCGTCGCRRSLMGKSPLEHGGAHDRRYIARYRASDSVCAGHLAAREEVRGRRSAARWTCPQVDRDGRDASSARPTDQPTGRRGGAVAHRRATHVSLNTMGAGHRGLEAHIEPLSTHASTSHAG